MENTEKLEKIKNLAKVVQDMGLDEPYKTETYKMMLAELLGKPIQPAIVSPATTAKVEQPKKKDKIVKTGRGNKSDIVIKIEALISNGFFSTPKTMRDIQNRLRELGYNIDLSKISPILLGLTQEGSLNRKINERKRFVYSKDNNHTGSAVEEPSQNLSGDDTSDSSELAS